jgi:hypothetical protein
MSKEKSDKISDAIVKSILTITIVLTCYLILGPYHCRYYFSAG